MPDWSELKGDIREFVCRKLGESIADSISVDEYHHIEHVLKMADSALELYMEALQDAWVK